MTDAERKTWQQFEDLVENIQRKFHPNASVTRDDHIVGKDSGTRRQIDVAVRYKLGPENVLIVVECKRHNRKIDVQEMESFVSKLRDVGANLGIMVSERGYTHAARNIADRHGIRFYKLRDARKGHWAENLVFRFFIQVTNLDVFAWNVLHPDGSPLLLPPGEKLRFIEETTNQDTTLDDMVREIWKRDGRREGEFNYRYAVYAKEEDGRPSFEAHFCVGFRVTTKRFSREASMELLGLTGSDGTIHTDAFKLVTKPDRRATYYSEDSFWKTVKSTFSVFLGPEIVTVPNEKDPKRLAQQAVFERLHDFHIEIGVSGGKIPIEFNFGMDIDSSP